MKKNYIPSERNKAIAAITGLKASNQKGIAKAANKARDGLGNPQATESEIIEWLKANWKVKQIELNIPQDVKPQLDENIPQESKQVIDENIPQESKQDVGRLVTVNYGKGVERRTVQIEAFYLDALKHIGIDVPDVPAWLVDNVGTLDKQSTDKRTGTAKKVKHAIIKTLLEKIPKPD